MGVKVSVLVYVLNDVSHAERCLRSVMGQTLKELELLVIDGGSTDGTLELAEKLAREDSRIRILSTGPGVGRQFNAGLREASGEYIGICESDDFLLPGMYERQYSTAREHDLDMLRADAWHFFGQEGQETFLPALLSKQEDLYGKVLNPKEDRRVVSLGVNSFWSGIYRRKFLMDQEIFMNETKGAAYQDVTFSFLTAVKAERAMLAREAFYCYRLDNPASSVNRPRGTELLGEEYRLLKERLAAEGLYARYRGVYSAWKVDSHLGFYDSLPEGQRAAYVPVMCRDIGREPDCGALQEELTEEQRKIIHLAGQSEELLGLHLGRTYERFRQLKQRLKAIGKEHRIVVFGRGALGRLAGLYLVRRGRDVVAYIDNCVGDSTGNLMFLPAPGIRERSSPEQQEEGLRIPVLTPEKGAEVYPDAVYVLASQAGYKAMKKQIQDLGIPEKNIISCGSYGYFLKHVLIGSGETGGQEKR